MRILVCGSRSYKDYSTIRDKIALHMAHCLESGDDIEYIIEGEAKGADILARKAAEYLNIPVMKFPADWEKYGKRAGMLRNAQMLYEGQPDVVLAFNKGPTLTRGTSDMVKRAERVGIPVEVYYSI